MALGCDRSKKLCSSYERNKSSSEYLLEGETEEESTCHKFGSSDSLLPGIYDDVALSCLAWACRSDYASLSCLNTRFNLLMKSGYLYELRKQLSIVEH